MVVRTNVGLMLFKEAQLVLIKAGSKITIQIPCIQDSRTNIKSLPQKNKIFRMAGARVISINDMIPRGFTAFQHHAWLASDV